MPSLRKEITFLPFAPAPILKNTIERRMRMFLDNTQLFFIPNQEKKIEFVLFS
jgi:hypothetical protein